MKDTCSRFRPDLIRLVYGEEVDVAAREHVRTCPACGAEERALAEVARALPIEPLPAETRERLVALGAARPPSGLRTHALAAAAALAIGIGLLLVARHATAPARPASGPVAAPARPAGKVEGIRGAPAAGKAESSRTRPVAVATSRALPSRTTPGSAPPPVAKGLSSSSRSEAWRAGVDVSLAVIGRRLRHLEDDRNFE